MYIYDVQTTKNNEEKSQDSSRTADCTTITHRPIGEYQRVIQSFTVYSVLHTRYSSLSSREHNRIYTGGIMHIKIVESHCNDLVYSVYMIYICTYIKQQFFLQNAEHKKKMLLLIYIVLCCVKHLIKKYLYVQKNERKNVKSSNFKKQKNSYAFNLILQVKCLTTWQKNSLSTWPRVNCYSILLELIQFTF